MPAADASADRLRDFALAEAAVREAGTLAMAHFHARPTSWMKGNNSPVSDADHSVDRLLCDRLTSRRPDYGWLSEETADLPDRLSRRRVWVVDPIDGTRAFLKGRREWVVSVALVEDGDPVVGFVYNPLKEEMYSSMRGCGAELNGKRLAVSRTELLKGARLLANEWQMQSSKWQLPWPDVHIERFNALAYRIALVASGAHDAALAFSRLHEWDVAAADLIVREAGGAFTDFDGNRFSYNQQSLRRSNCVAANPALHRALTAFISESLGPTAAKEETRT